MAEKRVVLEWSIENISCWHVDVHGTEIDCPIADSRVNKVRLCPRGANGREENLVVWIHKERVATGCSDCEVNIQGSDGNLLCQTMCAVKLQKIPTGSESLYDALFVVGPKFEEVINQIKKNESLQRDLITVRILTEGYYSDSVSHVRTVIDAFDTSLKYSYGNFKNIDAFMDRWKFISRIDYHIDNYNVGLDLFASEGQCTSGLECFSFKLTSRMMEKHTLVKICISTMNDNDQVIKHEEAECLFNRGNQVWFNKNPLPKYDEQDYHVLITLKIIRGKFQNYVHSSRRLGNFETSWNNSNVPGKDPEPVTDCDNAFPAIQPENALSVLSHQLMCLYQDQDFSDITLKCDNVSFPVHRAILSARSPVFKTMFGTDMKEAASGTVEIGDLDPSTLALFLTYLYTGSVEDLQGESALKLYYAADKYQVPSLKKECAAFLCDNVSIDNVCDILSFADKHQDDKLTSIAHEFILKSFNDVLKSKEWESLMKNEPFLAAKTVTLFAQSDHVGKIN